MDKIKAFAKVNLFLKVYPRNAHEKKHRICGFFCLYKKIYDVVYIGDGQKTKIECVGQPGGYKESVYITKCVRIFEKLINKKLKMNIKIYKNIPRNAGLGGSSSTISAIINWVIRKYQIRLTKQNLLDIATNVGSDIPFFLSKQTGAMVTQYGNHVLPKKIPCKFDVILTNASVHSKSAYTLMDKSNTYKSKVNAQRAYKEILKGPNHNEEYNDLWPFVAKIKPQLKTTYNKLKRKHNIVLSGSGGSFVKIWPKHKK